MAQAARDGWRLIALFGLPEAGSGTRLVAILGHDRRGAPGATSASVGDRYPSITPECPQAHAFEREIAEQCGVIPEGHPWLKPLRRPPADHLPPVAAPPGLDREGYPFFRIEGDEVHELAVGPVHAGILEPGHFRFQVHGEEVLFLEIVLGCQHRGVERLLETLDRPRAALVAESIAGDSVTAMPRRGAERSRRWHAATSPRPPRRSGAARSRSSGSRTTSAILARSRRTSRSRPPRPSWAGSAASA